jgi:hypothetical protein
MCQNASASHWWNFYPEMKPLSKELTPSELKLWTSFETDQIYWLLTREPDTVPEFRFNWYTINTADSYFSEQALPKPAIKVKAPVP